MNVTFAYRGHSGLAQTPAGQTLALVPNLARDPVAFDAPLLKPLRFREAMSALHDVVICDLRYKRRDKSAYEQWKKDQSQRAAAISRQAVQAAVAQVEAASRVPLPDGLERTFEKCRKRYWTARLEYSDYLRAHDMELWRMLVPCDPVITVSDDVVFFECFSVDESCYGCLTVNRADAFGPAAGVQFGTTNVDYSWDLYHHFQSLRSYRETRFNIDPAGFEVATSAAADAAPQPAYREEKIDLPQGWLRGFMQIQSAMSMPMATRVTLSREAVYSILAHLKRHKARTSPRAIRFELLPDQPPQVVLEPWETRIVSHATRYDGPQVEPIRVWGGRRLLVLSRLLPLADGIDVYLLGTGLPSFWVVRMGEMRLTLGLSGWTANDWTRGSAIDLFAPPAVASPDSIRTVAGALRQRQVATLAAMSVAAAVDVPTAAAALRHLSGCGQVICDLADNVYRWRQVMPIALGEEQMGLEHEELSGARDLMSSNRIQLESRQDAPNGAYVIAGKSGGTPVEILLNADGQIRRGKCLCGYYRRYGLRNGPCRHMLALRWRSTVKAFEAYQASSWYNQMRSEKPS